MALPTKEERIRRKKVLQAAGYSVPNTDDSWGPWWEEYWKKVITHPRDSEYYGRPSFSNFLSRSYDQLVGNTTYEREPLPLGGTLEPTDMSTGAQLRRTWNNWWHEGDPIRDILLLATSGPSKITTAGTTAAAQIAPRLMSILKPVGQAVTPSTWIGGISRAAGYEAPKWLLNLADLGASSYYAKKAGDEIDRNGLTWKTASNAAMSLLPMTRDAEAIEAVGNGVRSAIKATKEAVNNYKQLKSTYNDYKAIKNQIAVMNNSDILERTSKIDWNVPAIKTPQGFLLADNTKTSNLGSKLENFLGKPTEYKNRMILNHPEYGDDFNIKVYSQNGREYAIGENRDKNKVIYILPEDDDFNMIEITPEQDYQKVTEAIENAFLDSRYNFIESLPDDDIKTLVRNSNRTDIDRNESLQKLQNQGQYPQILKNSIENDINNIYLSDEYINRYLKIKNIDPNSFIGNLFKDGLQRNIINTFNKGIPKIYKNKDINGGSASTGTDPYTKEPVEFYYGFNVNANPNFLLNDWRSTIFHEFGHNLWADNTNFSNFLRDYNTQLINNNFNPSTDLLPTALNPTKTKYVNYLQDPDEFRQRIMEGIRYGIKNKLTPEEIYDKCQVPGFNMLRKYFSKEYLIKMLGLMLGTATPIMINTNNDRTN